MCTIHDREPELARLPRLRESQIKGLLGSHSTRPGGPAETHLHETENHVKRLEKVFQMHGTEPLGVDCPAIDGIIEEANDVAGDVEDSAVLDAALIVAAQTVEHYEITRYGSLIAWAQLLGRNDCASVLQQTLDEEKATDKKLTEMADSRLNRRAA